VTSIQMSGILGLGDLAVAESCGSFSWAFVKVRSTKVKVSLSDYIY
jgi:hypothetical protein